MERRTLLQWMLATGGLTALNRLSASDLRALGHDAHQRSRHSARQLETLDAHAAAQVTIAAELIIPASDTPGATQAGVTAFIDTMLTGWYPRADRDRFLHGLRQLDARATSVAGSPFALCPLDAQRSVLTGFDAEVAALRAVRSPAADEHWFAMLKYLTVWGYCTSEVGMRETLRTYPPPMRYDGNAPVAP